MTCVNVELHPNTTGVARVVVTYNSQSVTDLGLSSAYVNDATVTFNLWDKSNTLLVTNLSLPVVSLSPINGVYRAEIPSNIGVVLGKEYRYQFSVTLISGATWNKSGKVIATNPD